MTDRDLDDQHRPAPSLLELPASLRALGGDLSQAIRRDLQQRQRRHRTARLSAVGVGGLLALSGSALAAGSVFGVIDLNGVNIATRVSLIPVRAPQGWPDPSWTGFATSTSKAPDVYHLTGGESAHLVCGPTDPHPVNNIYVEATRTLPSQELQQILTDETGHHTTPATRPRLVLVIANENSGYPGAYRNVPIKPGRKIEPTVALRELPGVIRTNNLCPTPGIAGQPGEPSSPPQPGDAAVQVSSEDILQPSPDEGADTSPTLSPAEEASVIAASVPDQSPTSLEHHLLVGAAVPDTQSAPATEGQTSPNITPQSPEGESRETTGIHPGSTFTIYTVRHGIVYKSVTTFKRAPDGTVTSETTPATPDPSYGKEGRGSTSTTSTTSAEAVSTASSDTTGRASATGQASESSAAMP